MVEQVEAMPSSSFASSTKFSFGLRGVNCDIKYILNCSFGNIVALSVRQPSAGEALYVHGIHSCCRQDLQRDKGQARVLFPCGRVMDDDNDFKSSETHTVPRVPDSTMLP